MTAVQRDLLTRLAAQRCKLRRYPSGQWSRGGNKFRRSRECEAMLGMRWIERIGVTNRGGIELFDITEIGREALERGL